MSDAQVYVYLYANSIRSVYYLYVYINIGMYVYWLYVGHTVVSSNANMAPTARPGNVWATLMNGGAAGAKVDFAWDRRSGGEGGEGSVCVWKKERLRGIERA